MPNICIGPLWSVCQTCNFPTQCQTRMSASHPANCKGLIHGVLIESFRWKNTVFELNLSQHKWKIPHEQRLYPNGYFFFVIRACPIIYRSATPPEECLIRTRYTQGIFGSKNYSAQAWSFQLLGSYHRCHWNQLINSKLPLEQRSWRPQSSYQASTCPFHLGIPPLISDMSIFTTHLSTEFSQPFSVLHASLYF